MTFRQPRFSPTIQGRFERQIVRSGDAILNDKTRRGVFSIFVAHAAPDHGTDLPLVTRLCCFETRRLANAPPLAGTRSANDPMTLPLQIAYGFGPWFHCPFPFNSLLW